MQYILIFLFWNKETSDGGIDWGETESSAVEIEVVAAGTDCKYIFASFGK